MGPCSSRRGDSLLLLELAGTSTSSGELSVTRSGDACGRARSSIAAAAQATGGELPGGAVTCTTTMRGDLPRPRPPRPPASPRARPPPIVGSTSAGCRATSPALIAAAATASTSAALAFASIAIWFVSASKACCCCCCCSSRVSSTAGPVSADATSALRRSSSACSEAMLRARASTRCASSSVRSATAPSTAARSATTRSCSARAAAAAEAASATVATASAASAASASAAASAAVMAFARTFCCSLALRRSSASTRAVAIAVAIAVAVAIAAAVVSEAVPPRWYI